MGNCCRPPSPCGSAEETSVLLKDDSKCQVTAGGAVVGGTCGPAADEKKIVVEDNKEALKTEEKFDSLQPKPSPKTSEANATQENGHLQKGETRTVVVSPRHEPSLEIRTCRAQEEVEKAAGDCQKDLLECNSPEIGKPADAWEVLSSINTEGIPASVPKSKASEVISVSEGDKSSSQDDSSTLSDSGREENKEPSSDAAQVSMNGLDSVPTITAVVIQEVKSNNVSAVATESDGYSVREEASIENVVQEFPALDTSEVSDKGSDSSSYAEEPVTSAPADLEHSPKHSQEDTAAPACSHSAAQVATSSDEARQDVPEETTWEVQQNDGQGPEALESKGPEEEEEKVGRQDEEETGDLKVVVVDETEEEACLENSSEEDLYRGADELSANDSSGPSSLLDSSVAVPQVDSRCSLDPAVDILSYSEQEWRGNTAKSALIRKGYKLMSDSFSSLRRVRGDNYCALRATLFQALSHSTQLPSWLQDDITVLPEELEERDGLLSQWIFPGQYLQGDGTMEVIPQLKGYMKLLQDKWQAAVDCPSAAERQRLCESVFQGGEDEFGLLEALKLLMLSRAVELHGRMSAGEDVPLFCWLLFARDTSDCPRSFLSNHLSHVGLSAGLEQVEMFLLGYTLQLTLQVFRLYKADTEEFVTFYPDDHKDDWPLLSLVTEDDRHYNVPLLRAPGPGRS